MSYDKYKKIKKSSSSTVKTTIKNVSEYVENDEKTILENATSKPNEEELVNTTIEGISNYAVNEAKTYRPEDYKKYVSGVNCNADDFVKVSTEAEQIYHQNKTEKLKEGQVANEAFHIISSFKGTDIPPELVHKIGKELLEQLCGDNFYGEVATHFNTNNYHNHLIICAYGIDGYHKFKDEYHLYKKIRDIVNEISLRYGVEIQIDSGDEKKHVSEYGKNNSEVKSFRKTLKEDIKECMNSSNDFDEYLTKMEAKGYQIIRKKSSISYLKDGVDLTDKLLGNRFTEAGITEGIEKNKYKARQRKAAQSLNREMKRYTTPAVLSKIYIPKYDDIGRRIPIIIRLLKFVKQYIINVGNTYLDLNQSNSFPENIRLQTAQKKVDKIDEAIKVCEKYGIKTTKELEEILKQKGMNGKIKEYEAIALFEAVDKIEPIISILNDAKRIELLENSLGISKDELLIKRYTLDEINKNITELDPMPYRDKKLLFNKLSSSDYSLEKGSFDKISRVEGKQMLDFLSGKTTEKPPMLHDRNEIDLINAKRFLIQKEAELVKKITNKDAYHKASDKQKRYISSIIPEDIKDKFDLETMSRSTAIRLIKKCEPIKKEDIKYTNSDKNKPSKWQLQTLKDIKKIFKKEFEEINIEALDTGTANKLIDHYLSQFDDFKDVFNTKRKIIDYSSFDEKDKEAIKEIKVFYDTIAKYGLDTPEKIEAFKDEYYQLSLKAETLSVESKAFSDAYCEIVKVSNTLKNIENKSFIFGPLYNGPDTDYKKNKEEYSDEIIDTMLKYKQELPQIMEQLEAEGLSKVDINSDEYIPLNPAAVTLLIDLKESFPEYFLDENKKEIPINLLTPFEAYEIINEIKNQQAIEEKIEKLVKEEVTKQDDISKTDDIEKDKKRQEQSK